MGNTGVFAKKGSGMKWDACPPMRSPLGIKLSVACPPMRSHLGIKLSVACPPMQSHLEIKNREGFRDLVVQNPALTSPQEARHFVALQSARVARPVT